ncbi:MAG: hypothetical protein AB1414_16685 [bacterium]
MGKRSSKGNSRGAGIKTIMCSIAVICVLLGSSTIAQGIEWQWQWLKAKEQKTKQEKVVKKKNLPLRPKQIGTPTVQQLLDKVEANYHKIQDLTADYQMKVRIPENMGDIDLLKQMLGLIGDLIIQDEKFFFKAPDKLKWLPPKELLTVVKKNNVEYRRMGTGWGGPVTKDTPVGNYNLPWYTLLDPDRFDFYWRLDELITKFDTKVISHPEENTWVIEAVPKASNPEDDYNYPRGAKIELFIDYNKGVVIKINCRQHYYPNEEISEDFPEGQLTEQTEIKNFILINNTWIPTTLIKIQPPLPKYRPEEVKEEYTLSNIQINTGIPDSEFEF